MAPRAVLIGMPGAGKSTVGRLLAEKLHVPFADSDFLIRQQTQRSIDTIFKEDGEAAFRELEAQVIVQALRDFDGILSLGGGAVLSEAVREALTDARVLLINASDEVLVQRIVNSRTVRPLLQREPEETIKRLRKERMGLYVSLASHTIFSDSKPVAHVVNDAFRTVVGAERTVSVGGSIPYNVHVGSHLLPRLISEASKFESVMIVCSPDVLHLGNRLDSTLRESGVKSCLFEVPRGEDAKESHVLTQAWDFAGEHGIGRDGVVVAIGGGATTDLGGFVAATWLRGIGLIQVPTTLLSMVDAAVGGKTGINTKFGKNLVGAFYPPKTVLCDVDLLLTLPHEELLSGFGEIVKCGFISDMSILNSIAEYGTALVSAQHPALISIIERAIAVKARVVSEDLRESGLREILNYGHTLAHSIELAENYTYRHGFAVSIGCVFAAALAEAEGIAEPGFAELHQNAFASIGLPVNYQNADPQTLLASMYSDKKVRGGKLRFVVLSNIAQPRILENPSKEALDYAFKMVTQ
ncbi:3-dehydroquinate synthase [Arcanobacterium ihumii]|uniref:3-dehydroquinate synthase n=1 Tax=Arcanobacterium ihumii TaxID=2138162 RepID=UPI000F535A19|nr:3-dehydroquinate synthase [Arcanobacterium ihumii]